MRRILKLILGQVEAVAYLLAVWSLLALFLEPLISYYSDYQLVQSITAWANLLLLALAILHRLLLREGHGTQKVVIFDLIMLGVGLLLMAYNPRFVIFFLLIRQTYFILDFILFRFSRGRVYKWLAGNPPVTVMLSFMVVIFIGTILLMLPVASTQNRVTPFVDALFTSTSATCVTGLIVYDTPTYFSQFGQIVILLLIQIGGLGFMTVAILFSMAFGRRIGLKERAYLMEAVNSAQLGGVVRLVRHILIGTFLLEAGGAVLLSLRFCPAFGLGQGIWFGIFHSVSAFCNAGFDLMGRVAPSASLTMYRNDLLVNLVVLCLVVVGGIGFVVWDDILKNKLRVRAYSLHSKLVLSSTAVLILVSAVVFFFSEQDAAFSGLNFGQRALASLFQAITPRTAGFNTVDPATFSGGGTLFTMLLMVIGAGSGSTGGGIKISTFAVVFFSVIAYLRGEQDVNLFRRRLEPGIAVRAFTSIAFYLMLAFLGCIIIISAQGFPLLDVMFESLSALGTVGLSLGITRDLEPLSRAVIILLMYSGRLGSLTVFMAVLSRKQNAKLQYATEKVLIG
jgi:trk system potassium uptake protein TrkH